MAHEWRQPIDVSSLELYIERHVASIRVPLTLKQFNPGQSNPTYMIICSDGNRYVLRKKPPGKLFSEKAHQVEREYRIIRALGPTEVPVPEVLCLCEDETVIGTSFYIMEFLDVRQFTDPVMPGVSSTERKALWKSAVETIAKLHCLSPQSVNLENFGKPRRFYERQLATFGSISKSQAQIIEPISGEKLGDLPHFDNMVSFFAVKEMQPPDQAVLVHGDCKIDNMIFHRTEPRVIGILDWEMATIGHPLSDFCTLTSFHKMDDAVTGIATPFTPRAPGFPSREDCMRWYEEVTAYRFAEYVSWGDAFVTFREAVIAQGIAARFANRQASSARAEEYGKFFRPLAIKAWKQVNYLQNLERQGKNMKGKI